LLISILLNSLRAEKKKKIIEKELDETRKNYKVLIDNAPDAIVVYDIDLNRFVDINMMAVKLFGGTYTDILNTDPRYFFSSSISGHEFAEDLKVLFKKTMKGEYPVFDLMVQNLSGKECCCEVRLVRLPDNNHRLIRASFIDITLRKQAEESIIANEALLRSLNEDKDLFFSILAHDLRSPFSAIIGLTDLIKNNVRDYDISKIEDFIHHINISAKSTSNLLEDLLMWAGSQSGRLSFRPQILNFTVVCQDIISDMRLIAETKNIMINFPVTERIEVFADIDMLKTVLRNLMSNAIKFTNNGGHVDVFARELNSGLIISVADNGIGIPQQVLDKLFDISHKHTSTGTANEPRSGLGLLLCKEFIEKHGGEIWVESKNGCEFRFSLPMTVDYNLSNFPADHADSRGS
jgi:PAS domain S-box-containing protein